MHIRTDHVFDAFEATLELVDEEERARLARLLHASRDSVQRAVHDVLCEAVDEINAAAAGSVQANLVYGPEGLELRVDVPDAAATAQSTPEVEIDFDASEIERLTLRLPAELKEIASAAADQAGVSLNAWLTRLVTQEAGRSQHRGRPRGPGQTLRGWIGGSGG